MSESNEKKSTYILLDNKRGALTLPFFFVKHCYLYLNKNDFYFTYS